MKKNNYIYLATILIAIGIFPLLLISIEGGILNIFRIILGSIFILFLPGYYLVQCFFGEKEIDILEQIALSFALSISVIPLISFYLNLIGVPISAISVYGITLGVILMSFIYTKIFKGKGKKNKSKTL